MTEETYNNKYYALCSQFGQAYNDAKTRLHIREKHYGACSVWTDESRETIRAAQDAYQLGMETLEKEFTAAHTAE